MNAKISFSSIMKIVNIIFLIVLENFVLDCGMGIFGVSLLVYFLLYTLLFSSLQTGIAKMVSARNNKGINGNSQRIIKSAFGYVFFAGILVLAVCVFLLNSFATQFLGMTYPVPVITMLCIILILNGVTDVLCGYHDGNGNILIGNIVNLVKTVLPILFSLFVIRIFINYGIKVSCLLNNSIAKDAYAAMGVACIYVLTSIIAFLVAIILTIISRLHSGAEKSVRGFDSRRTVASGFFLVNSRLMLHNLFPVLAVFITVMLYINSAIKSGIAMADAYTNIGILFTKLFLPSILVLSIFSEYIGREWLRLRVDYRKDEIKTMITRAQYMIKNSFFMLLPPTMILTFLAEPIVKVFYSGQHTLSPKYLQTGGFILLLAGVAFAMSSIIKAFEKEVMIWLVQGGSLFVLIVSLLIGFAKSNGNSMIILYSFYIYYLIQICAFLAIILKVVRLDILNILMKLGKYGVASIIMMILFMILDEFIIMNILLILLSMFLGYLLYYLTLIALHGISKKDEATLKHTLNYYPVHFLRSRLRL